MQKLQQETAMLPFIAAAMAGGMSSRPRGGGGRLSDTVVNGFKLRVTKTRCEVWINGRRVHVEKSDNRQRRAAAWAEKQRPQDYSL